MAKFKALKKGTLVRVLWDDAEEGALGGTWLDESEVMSFATEETLVRSIGWVVKHTAAYLTIAGDEIDKLKHYGRVTKLTKPQIVSITVIEEVSNGRDSDARGSGEDGSGIPGAQRGPRRKAPSRRGAQDRSDDAAETGAADHGR